MADSTRTDADAGFDGFVFMQVLDDADGAGGTHFAFAKSGIGGSLSGFGPLASELDPALFGLDPSAFALDPVVAIPPEKGAAQEEVAVVFHTITWTFEEKGDGAEIHFFTITLEDATVSGAAFELPNTLDAETAWLPDAAAQQEWSLVYETIQRVMDGVDDDIWDLMGSGVQAAGRGLKTEWATEEGEQSSEPADAFFFVIVTGFDDGAPGAGAPYVGETEKNLGGRDDREDGFGTPEPTAWILFFDEADALF